MGIALSPQDQEPSGIRLKPGEEEKILKCCKLVLENNILSFFKGEGKRNQKKEKRKEFFLFYVLEEKLYYYLHNFI